LHRYDANVTLAFTQGFDDQTAKIGDVAFEITEDSISSITGLPQTGERWFKNKPVRAIDYNVFLVDEHQSPEWSKGILRAWVREGFQNILIAIHNFVTCEGRYGVTLLYHMRFLLHFYGNQPLNLPFFLLKSLTKKELRV
jgi:hypothetical protein